MAKKINIQNNYIKLGMILLVVILVVLIAANLYSNRLQNHINEGYLSSQISSIDYNEIHSVLYEFSGDTFLYVSYTGDRQVYNLDVKLKKLIDEYQLNDKFIYLDIKDRMATEGYLDSLNNFLSLTTPKIRAVPAIIYYKDNRLIEIIDSYNNLLTHADFFQLLEKYEIVNQ